MARKAGMFATAAASLMALTLASGAQAQGAPGTPYRIGERLRVTVPALGEDPIVGVLDSLRETVMVLDTAVHERRFMLDPGPPTIEKYRRIAINFDDIRNLEVSRGRSKKKGMLVGATIGAVIGAVSLGFGNTPQYNPGWADFKNGIVPGIAIGAPVGAALGYLLGRERWRPIPGPWKPGASPAPASRTE